jgi:nucleoside-diphosphate-sugar epimerase
MTCSLELQDRRALVTGGTKGIGAAVVLALRESLSKEVTPKGIRVVRVSRLGVRQNRRKWRIWLFSSCHRAPPPLSARELSSTVARFRRHRSIALDAINHDICWNDPSTRSHVVSLA